MQTSSSFSQKGRIQELQTVPINDNVTDKEIIRKEIRKMRHTRDALVQQRQELDELQHRVLKHFSYVFRYDYCTMYSCHD